MKSINSTTIPMMDISLQLVLSAEEHRILLYRKVELDIFGCCKDCPDRKIVDGVRCHSWCEKYKAEQESNAKRLKQIRIDSVMTDYIKTNRTRIIKRRNRRGEV